MKPPRTSRARASAGFSLMEVMLATLILAMGLGMVLAAVSQCLGVARSARIFDTTRELLSRVEAESPVETAEEIEDVADSGSFDDPKLHGYTWRREIEPVGDEKYGLFKVTTTVTWAENDKESAESLVTYVYNAKAAKKNGGGG